MELLINSNSNSNSWEILLTIAIAIAIVPKMSIAIVISILLISSVTCTIADLSRVKMSQKGSGEKGPREKKKMIAKLSL